MDNLAEVLNDAAVDFDRPDDECLYVTGEIFPFFLRIETDRDTLVFWTYLDAMEGTEVFDNYELSNSCNCNLSLVQFSFDEKRRRFYGHYALVVKDGLNPRQIVRTGRRFAATFFEGATEGLDRGLLQALGECSENISERAQPEDCTVH